MKQLAIALALLCVLIAAQPSNGVNYFWLTDSERSAVFPDDIIRFFGRDTLWGPIRTNGCFAFQDVAGWPTCRDTIIMGCDAFVNPQPPDICPVIFNAHELEFPEELTNIREAAGEQSTYFNSPGDWWRGEINDWILTLYYYPEGTEFDPLNPPNNYLVDLGTTPHPIVFVDGKLDLKGEISSQGCGLILGCSEDIRLIDDLMLIGTNMNTGELPPGATSRMAIASEQNIFVGNTWENGRENRTGETGDHADIVITALLFAMGESFQMEQMNDVDDNYIGPSPDERGNIVLTGGVTQRNRGYVHRSNRGGTGYDKVYHYDERLRNWRVGVFEPFDPLEADEQFSVQKPEPVPSPVLSVVSIVPNPFNATSTLRFTLPESGIVRAIVYDVLGREVARLADGMYPMGQHQLFIGASDWSTGLYFLRLEALGRVETMKLMLIK